MGAKETTRKWLQTVENIAWPTAIGSFAVDLFTALDTSGLTWAALATGITSFALRKTLLAEKPT